MSHLWQMQSIGCYIEEVHLVLSWALDNKGKMNTRNSKALIKERMRKILWSFVDLLSACVTIRNNNKEILGYLVEFRGMPIYVPSPLPTENETGQEALKPQESSMIETKK